MEAAPQTGLSRAEENAVPRPRFWAGWVLTGLIGAFFLLDAAMKILKPGPPAAGWPPHLSIVLGWILVPCALLFLIPRTAVLGAILLTGYLGGAVAANLERLLPIFTGVLFPVYFGVVLWAALWLRYPKLQELVPLRSNR